MLSLLMGTARAACAACALLVAALPVAAAPVATLRVMLHPFAAARGTLPPDAQAALEAAAGTSLQWS